MTAACRLSRILLGMMIPLGLLVGLLVWGFSSPVGSSPDDDYHMASIWCGAGLREGLCEAGDQADERRVPERLIEARKCYSFYPELSASCPQAPSSVLVSSTRGNFEASYPPVFYGALSIFAGSDISASVIVMRSVNALVFVSLVTGLFFALRLSHRGPLLWGGLVTVVPLGMFIIPSVNPSSWAVGSAMMLWIVVWAFFEESGRARKIVLGLLAILLTVMASGARSDAAVYSVVAIVIAATIGLTRSSSRRSFKSAIPLGLVLAAIAASFFVFAGQSAVLNPSTGPASEPTAELLASLISVNLIKLPELWAGALGTSGLGWLDTSLPGSVWMGTIVAFGGLFLWGARRMSVRKSIALLLLLAALIVVPLYILVKDQVYVGFGVQPRYIYPLVIMFAGVLAVGFLGVNVGLNRIQQVIIGTLVVVANSTALHTNIRRYVTGNDDLNFNLSRSVEWWWSVGPSPMVTWAVGSLSFAVAVAGILIYTIAHTPRQRLTFSDSESAHLS